MPAISLPAHFDGEHILLDQPFALQPNTKLMVTVLPHSSEVEEEREDWYRLALAGMSALYGDDEPEYTLDDVKVLNPTYEASPND